MSTADPKLGWETAFPMKERRSDYGEILSYSQQGLTKREFFAAMAMSGLRADRQQFPRDEIARMAVADADALLKELAK